MKKLFLNKKVRNIFHIIAGFYLGYIIANCTGLFSEELNNGFNKILSILCLFPFICFAGIAYEFIINSINKERKGSIEDVFRTGLGGIIAGLATSLDYSLIVTIILSIILIPLILIDIIYAYKTRNK